MFATGESEFEAKTELLKKSGFELLTTKLLDTPPARIDTEEALSEGVALFNQQRFWESHEVLEQVWREVKGPEHDAIQGLILTSAGFVHYQKGETEICLSVLRRAQAKLRSDAEIPLLDLEGLRSHVDEILDTGQVRLFKLRKEGAHPLRKRTTSAATKIVSARPPARSTPGTE